MRFCLMILLLGTALAAQADKILLLREAPQGCEEKGEVSVSSGSKTQPPQKLGTIFTGAGIPLMWRGLLEEVACHEPATSWK